MPTCHHLAPDGEKSVLYQSLEQKYGPDKAHDIWERLRSQEFINRFGNWAQQDLFGYSKSKLRLDAHGEPTMQEVETRMKFLMGEPEFTPANQEQTDSIAAMRDFIDNGNPDEFFTLEGKAGTGKTSIAGEVLAPYIKANKDVLVGALSNKAKLNLSNKLEDRFGKGSIESKSIAGMLGMRMSEETGEFTIDPDEQYKEPPIKKADIIVIDEASMVNEEALALIMKEKRPNAKVLFMGDVGQLPPIRKEKNLASEKPSPSFTTKNKASLVERIRQGEESPILPYADHYWNNSQNGIPKMMPIPEDGRKSIVTGKGSLVFANSKALMPKLMPLFKEAVETGNPDKVKIVVYHNEMRHKLNDMVHDAVFGSENRGKIMKGDLMMFQDNFKVGLKHIISNATEVQIVNAKQRKDGDWNVWEVEFNADDKHFHGFTLDYGDRPKYQAAMEAIKSKALAAPKGYERSKLWKEWFQMKEKYFPIDYSYAITSHKSQGSTYDVSVIAEGDIMSAKMPSPKSKSQSMYTALTRARHAAFIMDGKTNDEHMIDMALDLVQNPIKEAPKVDPPVTKDVTPSVTTGSKPVGTIPKAPEVFSLNDEGKETVTREFGKKGMRISEEQMRKEIDTFYEDARKNPEKIYRVPYDVISAKYRYSNNYNAAELANLFDRDDIPANVRFTDSFRSEMLNTYRRIIAGFQSEAPVELIGHEQEQVMQTAKQLLVPKVNAKGEPDGYFTPGQQKEIVDSIVSFTERLYRRDPALGANALIKTFTLFRAKQQQLIAQGAMDKAIHFTSIYQQRERLTEEALRQLEGLGLHTDNHSVSQILNAVRSLQPLTAEEQVKLQDSIADLDIENLDTIAPEFDEVAGHITRDWSDNTFELDPRDTASARIKMFVGTVYEMDRGVYTARPDGTPVQVPGDLDALKPAEAQALARRLNRTPFWAGDAASSKKLVEWLNKNYPRITKENFLGVGKTADYDQIFKELLNALGNKSQSATFEDFMAILDGHPNPTIQHIASELRKADGSMKNEFMVVMMKQYQPFVMALFNTARDVNGREYYVLNPIKSNRFNQRDTLIKHWQEQQKLSEITILSPSGERVLDVERIQKRWIPLLQKANKINDWSSEADRDWFIRIFGSILRVSGIGVTDEMMGDLFDNPGKWTPSESVLGLFGFNNNGQPTGLFSIFIMTSAGKTQLSDDPDTEQALRLSQLHNPLYKEKSLMQGLARLVAKYTPVMYSQNHRNSEGKSVWDWGLNTKLSHQFRQLVTDFGTFAANAKATDVSKHNYLVRLLEENPAQIKDLELSYFDGLKPTWGKRGTTRQAMSDREQLLTSIMLFQNRGAGFNRNPKVHFMSLTHSDKTMTPIFRNIPRVPVGRYGVLPGTLVGTSDSAFYSVFKGEYDRITKHANLDSGSRQYEKGKGLFYFLPDFNFDGMKALVDQEVITQEEMNKIYPGGGRQLTKVIDSEVELPVINKVLVHTINNLVLNTIDKWNAQGIVTENGNIFDRTYVQKLLLENGIKERVKENRQIDDPEKTEFVDAQNKVLSRAQVDKIVLGNAAKDYALNHFLFNTTLSQLFYGDPAETFKKSKEGSLDTDNVRSTMVEYAKRLAKDIAPRADLYWGKNRSYNAIYLSEVMAKEKAYEEIAALKKAYMDNEIESTNAQEVTTVEEHLAVLNASGKIPQDVYTEMLAIVKKGAGKYYEFTKPEHLAVIMQPQKPLYAGQRAPLNGIRLTDYVKTSSYPLYPPFTQGKEMDHLRKMMETSNIQRAAFETGVKMGNPKEPLKVFDAEGRYLHPTPETVASAIQVLDRSGFGIQQEVPYDPDKEAIKIITQMNENLVEGISAMKGFEIPGHGTLDGMEVKALKEKIRKAMIEHNLDEFRHKLNIDESGTIDPEHILDVLVKEMQTDTRNSYTLNEIQSLLLRDKDGTAMIPLMFSTAAPKFESMLMGMVNKISEFKMPGKSFVQASSTGYRFQNADNADLSNVIRVGEYDGSPLKPLRIENGVVKPGQVILPWSFHAEDGTKVNLEEFVVERDGTKYLDETRVPASLLQLIGARIPNQKHSSMHPLEVVGFAPENMGDIVLIPSALVTQMGGDFDVDKLYTYRRPYYFNKDTGKIEANETKAGENGEVSPWKSDLQTDYFNLHWAVLTHPDMLQRVMAPLDKNDLVEESAKLRPPRKAFWNYYDVQTQLEDFQSGKDAKRLVGSTSWAVKFSAKIQDKNLRYGTAEWDGEELVQQDAFIQIKDEHTGAIQSLGQLSGMGTAYYTKEDGGTITEDSKRSKVDNHVMVQSESVDNAKNRTLDNLNLTPDTYKAVQALIELQTKEGWAANSKYWTRLITQPVIKEFSRKMKQGNDSLSVNYDPNLYDNVMVELRDKYQEKDPSIVFDPQLLLKAQSMDLTTPEGIAHQRAALDLFDQLYKIGQRMFELEAQFNQDVSGAGRDLFSVMDKQRRLQDLDRLPVLGAEALYRNADGSSTETGVIFSATNGTALSTLSQVLPYRSLQGIFDRLKTIGGRVNLSMDTQRNVLRAFRSMAYTTGQHFWQDAQSERVRLFYGDDSLAKRVAVAQKTWAKDDPFLARLATKIGDSQGAPDYVEYNAASKVLAVDKQNITTGWIHLLVSEDESKRRLGEDLLRYAYLTGGVQDANSFIEFVPAAYIAGTELSGVLKDIERELRTQETYESEGFVIQYIQHNPEAAYQIKQDIFGEQPTGREFPETFEVPKIEGDLNKFSGLVDGTEYRPFLSYRSRTEGKWILYMRNQVGETTFYTRVDTLGNQFSDEYNGEAAQGQRSVFQENRALADVIPTMDPLAEISSLSALRFFPTSRKPNFFEQIGVKEGGEEALQASLQAIADNPRLPEYQRILGRFFADTHYSEAAKEAQQLMGVLGRPIQLKFDRSGDVGMATVYGGIQFHPEGADSAHEAGLIFLHEVSHNRLQHAIIMGGHDSRVNTLKGAARVEYQKKIDTFRRNNPEIIKILDDLERLRYEARVALMTRLGHERFGQVQEEFLRNEINTDDHLLYYATDSLQEFVAHVMGDDKVMKFLNDVQYSKGDTSILEHIWKMLADLLEAVGKALGVPVKDGSILKEALTRTMRLIDINNDSIKDLTTHLVQGGTLEVDSEAYARDVAQMVQTTYGKAAAVRLNGTNWELTLSNEFKKKRHSVIGQRGKILDKLYEQRDDLSEALNREKDPSKRVPLRVKYRELREQINSIQQTNNIDKIADVGRKQLEWVDQVLKTSNPTTVDVNLALNTAHIWENLVNILYGDLQNVSEISKAFVDVQVEAQKRRIELLNSKAQQVLTDTFKGDMTMTPLDFKDKLEDIDMLSANVLSLTRAKPKLVQATAALGWREANNRDEHIYRNTVRLQALEKKMKEAGLTDQMLLDYDNESGNWGLVNRLSGTWYNHVRDLRGKLNTILEATDKTEGLSDEQRGEKKREAWNNYWTDLKKTAVFVDSRAFFNLKTGARIVGESYDKALAKLAERVGSEAYAKELVQKAEERYQAYLSERDAMSEWLEGSTELTEEEKDGKTAEEQADALAKKKTEAMTKWLQYNSPVDLLNRLDTAKNINFNSDGDNWVVLTPHKELGEFYDEKYQKIEGNPKMKAAYDEYREILQEMTSYLPMEVQSKLPDNFLPIVPKDTANWLSQVVGKIKNWDTEMLKALAATDAEEASRLRPDKIPVMYTNPTGHTKELGNRSTDLVRVLELFSMMALQHRYMGNVLDTINVAEGVLREVNQRRIAGLEEGKPLRHVIDAMKYFKDALVFKKPKELQGKVESPIYTLNPAKQMKIEREIKALIKEKEALQSQIEDKMLEGDFDSEAEDKRIDAIDKQLTEYEGMARNIYGSKVVDALISINQMKALAYNPFSAVSNFSFAAVSVFIHARGRVDFDPQTTREAWGVMTHSMKKYWLFNGEGDETAQKVHALMNRAGIMGDVTDAAYGNNTNIPSRKKSTLRNAVDPMNWQKSGDYFTKGVLMVAMMKKKMVEYTDPSTGEKKQVSLWDAMDKEGKWNTEKYGESQEWYNDDIHNQTEWNRYRDRMRKVSMMVFGNQDKNAPLMAKKNWLLRMAAQFRLSWFPEGIATRWKSEYEDANLGRTVKGRWRTYQDLGILNSSLVIAKQMLAALPGVKTNPFEGFTLRNGKPLNESAIDVENMRKNFAGLAWTAALTATILMLESIGDDEHKKSAKARRRQLLLNMLIRNHQDLMLYSSPSVFNTISGNFLPATQVIVDYVAAMKATGHYFFGDTHKEKHAFESWIKKVFRAGIPHPTFTLYNKAETMMTRDLDKLQR